MGSGGFGDRFLELVIGDVPNLGKPAASPIGSRWLVKWLIRGDSPIEVMFDYAPVGRSQAQWRASDAACISVEHFFRF